MQHYNLFLAVVTFIGFIFSMFSQIVPVGTDHGLVNFAINGGMAAMMFVILYFTFKYFSTQLEKSLAQNQQQFQETMKQLRDMQKEWITQNQENVNRLFVIIQEDTRYKAFLAESISKMQTSLNDHTALHMNLNHLRSKSGE